MARSPQDPQAHQLPDPPGFTPGAIYRLPRTGSRGRYLGLATYQVQRIGIYAGQRQFIWTDPVTKVSTVILGPLAFEVFTVHGRKVTYVVGYRRDEFPEAGPLELTNPEVRR